MALAGVRSGATHLVEHAEFGDTTSLPLADVRRDDVLVAWAFDGEPLEPEHGYPVRLVLPHRYFWKSAKWLRGLEFQKRSEEHTSELQSLMRISYAVFCLKKKKKIRKKKHKRRNNKCITQRYRSNHTCNTYTHIMTHTH